MSFKLGDADTSNQLKCLYPREEIAKQDCRCTCCGSFIVVIALNH